APARAAVDREAREAVAGRTHAVAGEGPREHSRLPRLEERAGGAAEGAATGREGTAGAAGHESAARAHAAARGEATAGRAARSRPAGATRAAGGVSRAARAVLSAGASRDRLDAKRVVFRPHVGAPTGDDADVGTDDERERDEAPRRATQHPRATAFPHHGR